MNIYTKHINIYTNKKIYKYIILYTNIKYKNVLYIIIKYINKLYIIIKYIIQIYLQCYFIMSP